MDCGRLEKLIKTWYVQVQDEALAPARMLDFMDKHLAECEVCMADAGVRHEVKRISDIVLPPAKLRKEVAADDDEPVVAESDDAVGDEPVDSVDSSSDDYGDDETDFDD